MICKKDTPKAKQIRRTKQEMAGFLLKTVYAIDANEEWTLDILKALREQLDNEISYWESAEGE